VLADVDILISAGERLVFTLVLFGEEILEFKVEKRNEKVLVGSIFKGIVKKACRSLDGYFVDIGFDGDVFLQVKSECRSLREGQSVLAQLQRKELGRKAARLTCRISIPGKYLVYFPRTKKFGLSNRIKGTEYGKRLKERLQSLLGEEEGLIVRSSALKAREEEVVEELQELRRKWEEIQEKAGKIQKGLVHEELPLYARTVRDYWGYIKEIVVDNPDIWKNLVAFFGEDLREKLRFSRELDRFLGRYTLTQLVNRIFSKYVWLRSGGYLVIEETEAMVVIDVNSGEGCGQSLEENAYRTNIEALEEIAKQIKFRNLGGIIVVDLIDMKSEENRKKLLEEAKKIFERENVKVKIYGLSPLGLLEMTRKKEEESVLKVLGEKCSTCMGNGFVKSVDYILYLIEKDLERYKGKRIELRVHPRVAEALREFIKRKKLEDWVSIKEVWEEEMDYYELFSSEFY